MVNGHRVYGLIGKGISHSFSASLFNGKFQNEGIDAEYKLFDIPEISFLPKVVRDNPGLAGLNVTSPYKREVIPYLDKLTKEARELNAVNVIQIVKEGRNVTLTGHNTDCIGFHKTISDLIRRKLLDTDAQAIILGSGGAASAVKLALLKESIPSVIISRKGPQDYEYCNEVIPKCRLIVNATPVGMHPKSDICPDIDYSKIGPGHICYDLIYNPEETPFLKKAKARGAEVLNGLPMLINQAEEAWRIWSE